MCVRIISNRRRRGVLFAARIWRSATQKDMAGQDKLFFLAAFSNDSCNDSGCLREHFKVCFLYLENLTKEKWNRSVHQSQNLKEKVEVKRSPMAVLIWLSLEGLICTMTRRLRRDKCKSSPKRWRRLRVSGKTRNKIVVFPSYYLNFLAKKKTFQKTLILA